jgi:hypothetical protein
LRERERERERQRTRFSCEDDLAMPLPFQTFNGSDTAETLSPEALSSLDEWEAATKHQHSMKD